MILIHHKYILSLIYYFLQLTLVLLIFSVRVLNDGNFSIISVVLMSDLVSLCLSLAYVAKDGLHLFKVLPISFFDSVDEAVVLSFFSLLWIIKSVLEIMSIANLDPVSYQLLSHLNFPTLLLCSWILFRRFPSLIQCISVGMILTGVFFAQLQPLMPYLNHVGILIEQDPLIGLICALFVSFFSSVIGTYFKTRCAPQFESALSYFHLRFSLIRFTLCALVTVISLKPSTISELFHGYSTPLYILIFLLSLSNFLMFYIVFSSDVTVRLISYPLSLWPTLIFSLLANWVSISWQCLVSMLLITVGGFTYVSFIQMSCFNSKGL